jgi:hypothetical protein
MTEADAGVPAASLLKGHWFYVTAFNTTGRPANDLHLTIQLTGGTLHNAEVIDQPSGLQGQASVGGGATRVDVVWSSGLVQPNEAVTIRVRSRQGPNSVGSIVWTFDGGALG